MFISKRMCKLQVKVWVVKIQTQGLQFLSLEWKHCTCFQTAFTHLLRSQICSFINSEHINTIFPPDLQSLPSLLLPTAQVQPHHHSTNTNPCLCQLTSSEGEVAFLQQTNVGPSALPRSKLFFINGQKVRTCCCFYRVAAAWSFRSWSKLTGRSISAVGRPSFAHLQADHVLQASNVITFTKMKLCTGFYDYIHLNRRKPWCN